MDEQSINCCIIFKLGLVVDRTQTHLKRRRRRNHKGFFFKMYKYVNTTFVSVCFYYYYLLSNTQLILLPLSLYSLYKYNPVCMSCIILAKLFRHTQIHTLIYPVCVV